MLPFNVSVIYWNLYIAQQTSEVWFCIISNFVLLVAMSLNYNWLAAIDLIEIETVLL